MTFSHLKIKEFHQRSILSIFLILFTIVALFAQEEDFLIHELKGHDDAVYTVEFTINDQFVLSGGEDKTIKMWDLSTGDMVRETEAHYRAVKQIHCLNDGITIFSAGDRVVKSWTVNLEQQDDMWSHNTDVWSFDLTPDNKKLICGTYEKKVYLWDLHNNELLARPEAHEKNALSVAFSNDGKYFATGSLDRKVFIWNTINIEPEKVGIGHSDNIYDIEFTPDNKYLVSVSRDKMIKVWDVETGGHFKTMIGHTDAVVCVSIHPSGRFALTGSYDGSVILWNILTGDNVYSYIDHDGPINDVSFSHDGNMFASASNDEKVIVYEFSLGVIVQYYYPDDLKTEWDNNAIFDPKRKGESRTDYQQRMEKAKEMKTEIYEKYFQKLMKESQ